MALQKKALAKRKSQQQRDKPNSHAVRGEFYQAVVEVLRTARTNAHRAVNFIMVEAYWNVGRMIVEEEQQGKKRADYGEALIRSLSEQLTLDFGKGFNVSNLWAFKQFYSAFPILRTVCGESSEEQKPVQKKDDPVTGPSIRNALRSELSWSHYRF